MIFVILLDIGSELIWSGEPTSVELFSGPPLILLIMTGAGLLVGLIYQLVTSAGAPDVFVGRLNHRQVAPRTAQ